MSGVLYQCELTDTYEGTKVLTGVMYYNRYTQNHERKYREGASLCRSVDHSVKWGIAISSVTCLFISVRGQMVNLNTAQIIFPRAILIILGICVKKGLLSKMTVDQNY